MTLYFLDQQLYKFILIYSIHGLVAKGPEDPLSLP